MLLLESAVATAASEDVAELADIVTEISDGFHLHPLFVSLIMSVIVVCVARIIAMILRRTFMNMSRRMEKFTPLMAGLVSKTVSVLLWVITVVVVLGFFGINLTPVLAGLGITGVVLGFALQESIASFFSGVMIAVNNPFRVGDWIEIDGDVSISGTVTSMDMMCVTLRSGDNKKITVNNKAVWGGVITNYSYIDKRRLDMTVSVTYSSDTEKAKAVIMDLVKSYPEVLSDPVPVVEIGSFGDSSIDIIVRPYVIPSDYWKVYWKFNSDILRVLKANGLDMPFNQLVVTLQK